MQQQLKHIQSCFEQLMEQKMSQTVSSKGVRVPAAISDGAASASNDTDDTQEEPGSAPDGEMVKYVVNMSL